MQWHPDRLQPLRSGQIPTYQTAAGGIPISKAANPAYADVLAYSESFFNSNAPAFSDVSKRLARESQIAHALGFVDGFTYSNSREAFERAYKLGIRAFEVDLLITKDKHILCAHDQMEPHFGLDKLFLETTWQDIVEKDAKPFKRFSRLDAKDLLLLLDSHPDAMIITDVKVDQEYVLSELVAIAKAHKLEHTLERIIPQIYYGHEFDTFSNSLPYKRYIFTLYKTDETNEQVIDFAKKNHARLAGITIPPHRFTENLANAMYALRLPALRPYDKRVQTTTRLDELRSQWSLHRCHLHRCTHPPGRSVNRGQEALHLDHRLLLDA